MFLRVMIAAILFVVALGVAVDLIWGLGSPDVREIGLLRLCGGWVVIWAGVFAYDALTQS